MWSSVESILSSPITSIVLTIIVALLTIVEWHYWNMLRKRAGYVSQSFIWINISDQTECLNLYSYSKALADLGGACPPTGPNSFVFAYIFTVIPASEVNSLLTGRRPPMGFKQLRRH